MRVKKILYMYIKILRFLRFDIYLKEAYRKLDHKEVYEQVPGDSSVFNTLITSAGGIVDGHS